MNQMKFNLYNFITPRRGNIKNIGEYIIHNNITVLPTKLRNNQELFDYLIRKRYKDTFTLNFTDAVYKNVDMKQAATFVTFSSDKTIPPLLSKNATFCRELINLALTTNNSSLIFDTSMIKIFTEDNDIYPQLDKLFVARVIDAYNWKFTSLSDQVKKDKALVDVAMANGTILPFNLFDSDMIAGIDKNAFIKYLSIHCTFEMVESLPKAILTDRDILLKICSFFDTSQIYNLLSLDDIPDDIKCYLMTHLNLKQGYYSNDKLDETLADYIIKNNIKELPDNVFMRSISLILLKKGYEYFFDLYGNTRLGWLNFPSQEVANKLISLFIKSRYTGKLSDALYNIIFNNPQVYNDIALVGDYIINNNILRLDISVLSRSQELFDYLYAKGYDNLLQLEFDVDIFMHIGIDKLREYYQLHPPEILNHKLNTQQILSIISLNIEEVDYTSIKPILLYESRLEAGLKTSSLGRASLDICNALRNKSVDATYAEFRMFLSDVEEVMEMSHDEFIELLSNYKADPAKYMDTIIDLFRRFCAKKKEMLALDIFKRKFENIESSCTVVNAQAFEEKLKMAKQKERFLRRAYFILQNKTGNLTSEKEQLLKIIHDAGAYDLADNQFDLIYAILLENPVDLVRMPPTYSKKNKYKSFVRLKQNYEKLLVNIIAANRDYEAPIIEYLEGRFSHEELRKLIDVKTLTRLKEIRDIYLMADASLGMTDTGVTFIANFTITEEEQADIKAYDETISKIGKLRKSLIRFMNESVPLDSIDVSHEKVSVEERSSLSAGLKRNFNASASLFMDPLVGLLHYRNMYHDSKTLLAFDNLFMKSGILYGILFTSGETRVKLYDVACHMDYVVRSFDIKDIKIENLDAIIKAVQLQIYTTPLSTAILGDEVSSLIAYGDGFVHDTSNEGRKRRVANAAKFISLASHKTRSTIPYTSASVDGVVAERYHNDDPHILTAGIQTGACFRLEGNDNDFLLYTLFNKNGIVVKFTDKNGRFIGRMSGFRNGNVVYFNQLRTIYDVGGKPDMIALSNIETVRRCAEKYAQTLIDSTAQSEQPIEHVVILKAYGYGDEMGLPVIATSDVPTDPMSSYVDEEPMFLEMYSSYGFTTDYRNHIYPALLMASASNKSKFEKDEYDPKAIYDRPRKKVEIYRDKLDNSVIQEINSINARYVFWGDQAKREEKISKFSPITDVADIACAVVGQDFYILVNNQGEMHELCLPYDDRAEQEFLEYHNIILSSMKKDSDKVK